MEQLTELEIAAILGAAGVVLYATLVGFVWTFATKRERSRRSRATARHKARLENYVEGVRRQLATRNVRVGVAQSDAQPGDLVTLGQCALAGPIGTPDELRAAMEAVVARSNGQLPDPELADWVFNPFTEPEQVTEMAFKALVKKAAKTAGIAPGAVLEFEHGTAKGYKNQ